MISITPANNTPVNFGKKPSVSAPSEEPKHNNTAKRIAIPTMAMLMYMNAIPMETPAMESNDIIPEHIETIQNIPMSSIVEELNPTQLGFDELLKAPDPTITIKGKQHKATIVVDTKTNKLYRYEKDGQVKDGYHIATGVIGRNGKSITDTGIRQVDHIETYPYTSAVGTKRKKNPKAYGPNVLYLTIVDPKTGDILGSNGEFIHGNNDASSIGKHKSHGCMRMDNEVIKKFAQEVPVGSYVLIK